MEEIRVGTTEEGKSIGSVGTVTISTAEYRDLVYTLACNTKDAESFKDKYWVAQCEIANLKNEISSLKEKIDDLNRTLGEAFGG